MIGFTRYLSDFILLIFSILLFPITIFRKNNFTFRKSYDKAILMCHGPSLSDDFEWIVQQQSHSLIFAVNFFACTKYFPVIKPDLYLFADPVYWRSDTNADFSADNKLIVESLSSVDWPMYIVCPPEGISSLKAQLGTNPYLHFSPLYNLPFEFNNIKLYSILLLLGLITPSFSTVAVLSVWTALSLRIKRIYLSGFDFSFFREYFVDPSTNLLYSSYSHFYKNTKAQSNAQIKYIGQSSSKMIHTRLSQCSKSFNQMFLLSKLAKRLNLDVFNLSQVSYLDCFERVKSSNVL